MKKIIGNGIKFFGIVVAIYLFIFTVLFIIKVGGTPLIYRATTGNVWEGGLTYKKFKEFNPNQPYDILFVGSSHTHRGYDPRIFEKAGYKSYNLGTDDQHMMCTYYLTKNYINNKNCKVLIIDVYDRVMAYENLESITDFIQNINSEKAALDVARSSRDIRAINMYTLRWFNKLTPPLNHDTADMFLGYNPMTWRVTMPQNPKRWQYRTNQFQLDYLEALIEYCLQNNIKPVLVELPLPSPYIPRRHDLFVADINKITNKYNITFLDYTEMKPYTFINYFGDETHLNDEGVKAFNPKLLKDLIEQKLLPHPSLID